MIKEARKAEILLEYANAIPQPPISPKQMHQRACSNDGVTIDAWRDIWIKNVKANAENYDFTAKGIGHLFGQFSHLPV